MNATAIRRADNHPAPEETARDVPAPPLPTGTVVVDRPTDLRVIRDDAVAAAIWRRRVPDDFRKWIDGLDRDQLPALHLAGTRNVIRRTLKAAFDTARTPTTAQREWLIADIGRLAEALLDLTGASGIRLRLAAVATDACRKFHRDRVAARLVCTYRGPGTQYGLRRPDGDPHPVHCVPTGQPIVLRGTLWPGPNDPGLVHRSPPIDGSGATRLVLVIDPVLP